VTFFLLNKLIHFHHDHSSLVHDSHADCSSHSGSSIAYLNLLGDGIHNFLDGLIIAGSYLISIPAGIATTIAVAVHEAPQEIADFGVLLYAGFSKRKALLFNFLSAVFAVVGAVVGLLLAGSLESFTLFVIPFAAGAFIYIAGSNLIPELVRREGKFSSLLLQLLFFVVGVVLMYFLLFFE
jgi:zinc and cadmium transporter